MNSLCLNASYLEMFLRLEGLEDDWDGYGTAAPSDEAIRKAKRCVCELARLGRFPSKIGASAEGGVGIVFRTGIGRYAEIEVFNDGAAIACAVNGRDDPDPAIWDVDLEDLKPTAERIRAFIDAE